MEKFEFKSAICTTKEQSERLLALGLKKETADMCWQKLTLNGEVITYPAQDVWHCSTAITDYHIPAWSLDRLREMLNKSGITISFVERDTSIIVERYGVFQIVYEIWDNVYDNICDCIEWLIKEGYFNQDYLEERK